MNNIISDMFEMLDVLSTQANATPTIATTGLKSIIARPHNLYTIKNDNGQVIAYKIAVVTTPFKKEDVKVTVCENTLTIKCGSENYKDEDEKFKVYHGISARGYECKLKLTDIDTTKISAKNQDGILTVYMPVKASSIPEERAIAVE